MEAGPGHDKEVLRRLDAHGERLGHVEAEVNGDELRTAEASLGYGKWRAVIRGVSAHQMLTALFLAAILAVSIGSAVLLYSHLHDARAAQTETHAILRDGNAAFLAALKELTSVQREGNCLTRTKGQDPELCRSMAR